MSKSLLQNIPDANKLVGMGTEELAGYVLEHLHAKGGNPLSQGDSFPHNLANSVSPRYSLNTEQIYRRIVAACNWLINNGFLDIINEQGFYEISSKGNLVNTAETFTGELNRSKYVTSPASPANAKDSGLENTQYEFPRIELSDAEVMWLKVIVGRFLSGYLADTNELKKSLHSQGKWPKNFRPSEIDYRLFQRENIPTLLGVWHADPENALIAKFDELIKYLQAQLPTTKRFKVADIALSIGISEAHTSILIHLLPSVGLGYAATGKPAARNRVVLPGELGIYETLELEDPEHMDGYLEYENLQAQVKSFYGNEDLIQPQSAFEDQVMEGLGLYNEIQSVMERPKLLDRDQAHLMVIKISAAKKLIGTSNHEKQRELEKWEKKALRVLPPSSFKEIFDRAAEVLLEWIWPQNSVLRLLVLLIALLITIISGVVGYKKLLIGEKGSAQRIYTEPKSTASQRETLPVPGSSETASERPQNIIGSMEDLPKEEVAKLDGSPSTDEKQKQIKWRIHNNSRWVVRELVVKLTIRDESDNIVLERHYRLRLSEGSSGEPYKTSEYTDKSVFPAEYSGVWNTSSFDIESAKGVKQ